MAIFYFGLYFALLSTQWSLLYISVDCYKLIGKKSQDIAASSLVEYKGPVFLIRETDDNKRPFVPSIVDGGIELTNEFPRSNKSGSTPTTEVQEDVDYFAVLVTPETIASSHVPLNVDLVTPLGTLLYAASARIPWMLALKKTDHTDYYRSLLASSAATSVVDGGSAETFRRFKRQSESIADDYLILPTTTDTDKRDAENICADILKELFSLNAILQNSTHSIRYDAYGNERLEQFQFTDTVATTTDTKSVDRNRTSSDYESESELFFDRLPDREDTKHFSVEI